MDIKYETPEMEAFRLFRYEQYIETALLNKRLKEEHAKYLEREDKIAKGIIDRYEGMSPEKKEFCIVMNKLATAIINIVAPLSQTSTVEIDEYGMEHTINEFDIKVKPEVVFDVIYQSHTKGIPPHHELKNVFTDIITDHKTLEESIRDRNLNQAPVSNDEVFDFVNNFVTTDPKALNAAKDFLAGNAKAINTIKGPIMKNFKGKVNPQTLDETLKEMLSKIIK